MSDTNNPGDKTQARPPSKPLSLKRPIEQGTVRQSFSHGRTKQVVVETVKRRVIGAAPAAPVRETTPVAPATRVAPPPPPAAPRQAQRSASGVVLRTLSEQESNARAAALADAKRREAEAKQRAEADAAAERERLAVEQREREAAEARKRDEEARRRQEEEARLAAAEEARRAADEAAREASKEAAKAVAADDAAPAPAPTVSKTAPMPAAPTIVRTPPAAPRAPAAPAATAAAPVRPAAAPAAPAARPPLTARPASSEPRKTITADVRKPRDLNFMARPAPAPEPEPTTPTTATAARPAGAATTARTPGRPQAAEEENEQKRVIRRPGMPLKIITPPKTPKQPGGDRNRGRLTIATATSGEDERTRSVASFRRRQQRMSGNRHVEQKEKLSREVTIPETITIQELANRMSERAVDVIRLLMKQGEIHKITDVIDSDSAQLIAEELGHTVRRVAESDVEEGLFSDEPELEEDLDPRPPVVTIMGHVDHGKTSLLDAIRKTTVVSGEAGGITQHIGAYQVAAPSGDMVTFIDTPGHAAFTSMRARGAKVTDIVVLVVAADDGVMPQTVEAIAHAKAAGVPLILAINKIDKPEANPQRVRTELLQHDIQVESMGGETLEFEVSAKTGDGLEELLDGLQLQAEIMNLRANETRDGEGTVIEAKLDRGRGPVATVLVQRGTLFTGDIVVAGAEWGRVRALIDDKGENVPYAGPSVPVEVLGFNGTPDAGDRVVVVPNEARAREVTEYRARQKRERIAARTGGANRSLVDMMRDLKEGAGRKELALVVKGDVQGSVEAITGALEKLGNDEVSARILLSGVGGITESDITLAEASKAVVIGFNVRAHKEARESAENKGVEIRYYNIIYDLVDDIKATLSGMLPPTLREERLGEAQILQIFDVSKVGKIAGCRVTDGVVQRGAHVRLIRDSVVIHEGKLSQLKRLKDDAKEVISGYECGMSFENFQDMRAGDTIECYRVEEIRRTL
ncbi:translation initiation factor IF-2 [Methylobacterium sp. Leaf469]|uniref:translation initiation factor IF-2 n=1 Tax=unclassified Methylobacterium TaxID=2615210 RepID=UPI0006F26C24|nr:MULTISPECIES: translation initiation factor IF-2 [unclassified Methylobacterium]KQO61972.1 translation initiation factor IF-2 [Methylobacterium sp. Leaf87]KQP34115.1 translation initiation factor IF-2 [Methylobacterium sp. Leaf102]KQU05235.1 translation initiation factor IF-2 [Methylobacterium sp. Leaf469]USU33227.1 translation initiation factor IF-2 [Methylobacterium sp. OTU13CASTA1]